MNRRYETPTPPAASTGEPAVATAELRVPIEQRYPWRVRCPGCGWIDHFDTEATAREWADRHNAQPTWPHDAKVGPRD